MNEPRPQPHRHSLLRHRVEAYERRLIEEALRATGYHQRHAASALGILPSTLCEKMKRLGILSRLRSLSGHAWPAAEASGPRGRTAPGEFDGDAPPVAG